MDVDFWGFIGDSCGALDKFVAGECWLFSGYVFFYSDNGCGEQVLITEYYRKQRGRGHYQIRVSAVEYLIDIVQNPKLDLSPKKTEKIKAAAPSTKDLVPDSNETIPDLAGGISCLNGELRSKVVKRL